MSKIKVAAVQMVSGASVNANLERAGQLIGEAAAAGARLVLLPEYFCLMGHRDGDKVLAREQPGGGPIQRFLADAARRHSIWIVGGTMPMWAQTQDKVRNATLVYSPEGRCSARYDKIHLFGFTKGDEHYDEARTIEPGTQPVACDVAIGGTRLRVGLSVCYDLRFPELFRALGSLDLLLLPAAFTWTTGKAHWETLLRARAIENQCYVLASAQGGTHENGRRTWGHSMLIDPWGEVVGVLPEGEGVVSGEIDLARIAEIRQSLPALRHRVM